MIIKNLGKKKIVQADHITENRCDGSYDMIGQALATLQCFNDLEKIALGATFQARMWIVDRLIPDGRFTDGALGL